MPSDDDIPVLNRNRLRWKENSDSLLGQGSFGMVYRGTYNRSPVAIKVVKPVARDNNTSEEYRVAESAAMKQHRREIHRFKVVQNPFIIQFVEVFRGQNPRDLFIVTELLDGGSLHDSLTKMRARKAVLDDRSFLQLAQHMAFGLNHVHSKKYTHGDMKPQNVLLTTMFQFSERGDGTIVASFATSAKAKIADFGLSKRLDGAERVGLLNSSAATTDFGNGPCGTYLYMSPEAFMGVSTLSDDEAKAADVYAYGLVLFELLSGLQSWGLEQVRNPMQLALFVRGGKRPSWGERKDQINKDYVKLVEQCWSNQPKDRPTMDDIVTKLLDLWDEYENMEQPVEASSPQAIAVSNVTKTESSSRRSSRVSSQRSSRASRRKARSSALAYSPVPPTDGGAKDDEDGSGDDNSSTESQSTIRHVDSVPFLEGTDGTENSELVGSSIEHRVGADKFSKRPQVEADSGSDSGSDYDSSDTPPKDNEGAVVEPEPQDPTPNGIPEIDQSIVGGVMVHRVQSVAIQPPAIEPLQMNPSADERQTWGLGSVAGEEGATGKPQGRADLDLLNSFLDAPVLAQGGSAGNTYGQEAGNAQYPVQPSPVHMEPSKDIVGPQPFLTPDPNISSVTAEPGPGFPVGQEYQHQPEQEHVQVDGRLHSPANYPVPENEEPRLPHSRIFPSRSYSSPDVDDDTLSEFLENDNQSLSGLLVSSKPHSPANVDRPRPSMPSSIPMPQQTPHRLSPVLGQSSPFTTGMPNGAMQQGPGDSMYRPTANISPYNRIGNSAPPPTDGMYGRPHAMQDPMARLSSQVSSWQSPEPDYRTADSLIPPFMNLATSQAPGMIDQHSVFLALQSPDSLTTLFSLWKRGSRASVAKGLASARDISGTEMLSLACEFLKESNQVPAERQDPIIAKDLCMAIGNIARNDSDAAPVSPDTVLMALRVALSTMFTYHQSFNRNVAWSVQVYAACNFALCNLFKVHNVIQEPMLRTELANWIAYSISWNVYQDGVNQGPHLELLAYTATSAARNFMWMNEDNVAAFASKGSGREAPATSRLISSMKYFDWAQQSMLVLEASLSALAVIIHFPQQRVEFMNRHGVLTLLEVLQKYAQNPKIVSLVFSMITVLLSGPTRNDEEVEALRKGFMVDDGCQRVVSALDQVRKHVQGHGDGERIEALEKGYSALLTVAKFCDPLRSSVGDKAKTSISTMARWLSAFNVGGHTDQFDDPAGQARIRLGVTLCELIQELCKERSAITYLREQQVAVPLEHMLRVHGANDGFAMSCRAALATLS